MRQHDDTERSIWVQADRIESFRDCRRFINIATNLMPPDLDEHYVERSLPGNCKELII
jgi:hypothetical protein